MKNIWKYVTIALLGVASVSCVHDLNTTPIDKNSVTGFNQDALFTKIYATLATTGQQGPAGAPDVAGADEGVSGFYRVMWELNEFPTDEGWWVWADAGVGEARTMEWNGDNALVKMLYDRFIIVIKYCNHFLEYASADGDGAYQIAEVRFIRALNYWYMLDMFRYAPFQDKESFDYPEFISRPNLYAWLDRELMDLTTALPPARLQLYRVDRTAAWLLLARLRLNAEVYTGTPQWKGAKDAADMAINGGYQLHTDSVITPGDHTRFSAYQMLFMGDNDKNGAQKEAVLLVYQDGNYCQSYCGAQFCIAANRTGGMTPWGCSANWTCFRSSPELVYKFFPNRSVALTTKANEFQMPLLVKDDRAILCSAYKSKVWKLEGGALNGSAAFMDSWACPKFTGVYSTVDSIHRVLGSHSEWADTDIPFMRIAEAYLIRAEAEARLAGWGGTAGLKDVNTIRARANAAPLTTLDEETMCDEWCREFWGEGRRRTDLIRFGRFAGPQADNNKYQWEGRAASAIFKSGVPEYINWFPIPSDDKRVNPNFKKQVLEDSTNPYASQGGDGYTYAL